MRVLKIIGGVLAGLVILMGLLFFVARMGDGPLGPLPGGPLVAGDLVTAPVDDWGFAESIQEIELQLDVDDISRTTWILIDGGRAYVPASLSFPPGKDWYVRADENGEAVIRVEGRRYPVRLERERDAATQSALVEIAKTKYAGSPPGEGGVWFFSVQSRRP